MDCRIRDDEDLIKWSAVQTALQQKDMLDDALYRALDSMHDYMHTLQYEDINRLLMLDIHQVSDTLHHFDSNGACICMPCFDEDFNRRYLCAPAMFTYPQYQRMLRGYQPYLRWGMYGDAPYAHGFGLCECLHEDRGSQRIVLYLRKANRLYLMESAQVIERLCLDVKAAGQDGGRLAQRAVHGVQRAGHASDRGIAERLRMDGRSARAANCKSSISNDHEKAASGSAFRV